MMAIYAQLWDERDREWSQMDERMIKLETPYLVRGLGTDSYMKIDGRLSRLNMIGRAKGFLKSVQRHKPWVKGVRIILTDNLQHNGRTLYQLDVGMEYKEDS